MQPTNAVRDENALIRMQRIASLGAWELDLATNEMQWSDETLRIYGVTREQFTPSRRFFRERIHPDDAAKVDAAVNELIFGGQPCEITFRIVRPDGAERFVRECAELETDTSGAPVRLVGTVQDISDYKALEGRFHLAQRRENLCDLSSAITHEFGNLLTVIHCNNSLIRANSANETLVRKNAESAARATQSAAMLVRQLQTLGRDYKPQVEVCDLNLILRDFDSLMRPLLGERIEVSLLLDPEALPIEAVADEIRHVLIYAVLTARDSMKGSGRLRIETTLLYRDQECDGWIGPGVGSSVALTITYSGEQPAADSSGMSMVRELIGRRGGAVQTERISGLGTRFRISLPLVCATEFPDEDGAMADPALCGNETILIVEDQPEVRTLASLILENFGYRVITAPNGASGLQLSREYPDPIHLLLTDIVMPGVTGEELAAQMTRLRPAMRVLFMSGYTPGFRLTESLSEGRSFIRKPFEPAALAASVRKLLGEVVSPPATIGIREALLQKSLTGTGALNR